MSANLPAFAQDDGPRTVTIMETITNHLWLVVGWKDNLTRCEVTTIGPELPTSEEILHACGSDVHEEWLTTPACTPAAAGGSPPYNCKGVYLHYQHTEDRVHIITEELPSPELWISLEGCYPSDLSNICPGLPQIRITGFEPLPGEEITTIHARLGEEEISCQGQTCLLPFYVTSEDGSEIEFWGDSSFGDSSETYTAMIRITDNQDGAGFTADVISSQWQGVEPSSCAVIWDVFPPSSGLPAWLQTPEAPEGLSSTLPYAYLAGRLIRFGLVDAGDCIYQGLLPNGYADSCGQSRATAAVQEWQNQFDEIIHATAVEKNMPARLIKNLFASETQFWGAANRPLREYGLGQISEQGAEALLMWNHDFFLDFCPAVLDPSYCEGSYFGLEEEHQSLLRGALTARVDEICPACRGEQYSASRAASIDLFTDLLMANCEQVAQIINALIRKSPGEVATYEDLWRFTLANYNAGPGCLSWGIYQTYRDRVPITWENVSSRLTPACNFTIDYVNQIARE
ncbi:MAG: hypothetical protein PVF70_09290 [Anaerolineales bacterium]